MLTISALTFSSAEAYKQGMAAGQELRLGIKNERRKNKGGKTLKKKKKKKKGLREKKKIMKGERK